MSTIQKSCHCLMPSFSTTPIKPKSSHSLTKDSISSMHTALFTTR
ncbi:hypothetical protein D0T50_03865 [Bacteroides sp. 214]|nr:hypothetical protein [Bacteroides sp. 214]